MTRRSVVPYLVLALAGVVLSAVLLYHDTKVLHGFQAGPSFCVLSSFLDCDRVARSSHSHLLGVPLASWGLIYYLALTALLLFLWHFPHLGRRDFSSVMVASTLVTLPPTVYLFSYSIGILGALCLLCTATYGVNILLATIAVRTKEANTSAVRHFVEGCALVSSFLLAAVRREDRRSAESVLAWFALAAAAAAGIAAPSFIVSAILSSQILPLRGPQDSASALATRAKIVARAVQEWSMRPQQIIDIQREGDRSKRDFTLGPAAAPVKVVVFSDYECPHCKIVGKLLQELQARHGFELIYKNFPLDQACNPVLNRPLHKQACLAARLSRCAPDVSVFWIMHDEIMALDRLTEDALRALPERLGLEDGAYQRCIDSEEVKQGIARDIQAAVQISLQGTPGVFVNGRQVTVFSSEVLEAILERAEQDQSSKS